MIFSVAGGETSFPLKANVVKNRHYSKHLDKVVESSLIYSLETPIGICLYCFLAPKQVQWRLVLRSPIQLSFLFFFFPLESWASD